MPAPVLVRNIMTTNVASCSPATALPEVARMMVEHDCGGIPVVEIDQMPLGMVTDRDIICRAIAQGQNARDLTARDCMSTPCVTVERDTSLEDCCRIMQEYQIRRVVVVDDDGRCTGIVAQADLARHAADQATDVIRAVSRRPGAPSRIAEQALEHPVAH